MRASACNLRFLRYDGRRAPSNAARGGKKAMKGLLFALAAMAVIAGGIAEVMAQTRTCTTTCQNNTGGGKTCTKTCY
jgi:hypothetical protein